MTPGAKRSPERCAGELTQGTSPTLQQRFPFTRPPKCRRFHFTSFSLSHVHDAADAVAIITVFKITRTSLVGPISTFLLNTIKNILLSQQTNVPSVSNKELFFLFYFFCCSGQFHVILFHHLCLLLLIYQLFSVTSVTNLALISYYVLCLFKSFVTL